MYCIRRYPARLATTSGRAHFTGASGLFSFCLKPVSRDSLAAMVESLQLFGMGFSWGGFESLIVPQPVAYSRSVMPWPTTGVLVRLHAGLETVDDLIIDLQQGFTHLKPA